MGSTLKRKGREINFSEQSYLSILTALNTARLRQKNLQMTSATLKIINPPVLPINAEPNKRKLVVAAAFLATFLFVLGFFILLEPARPHAARQGPRRAHHRRQSHRSLPRKGAFRTAALRQAVPRNRGALYR